PTATPTALGIPVADANGDIDSGWLKDASTTVKGIVELATSAEVLAGTDTTRAVTPDTLTDKILGTVSQSSGSPTGAIIESGSNANGEYVKFADGTMICTGRSSQSLTAGAPSGAIYFKQMTAPTFPATFITVTGILASTQNIAGAVPWINPNTYTSSSVNLMFCASASFTDLSVIGRYVAIGRWF
ncbi:hypothetical protein EOM57_06105, partial [Candidatus Saccharibacteria bacterium]|nr:hypothetical protein [Candidatus Saccharibacteria bacterium]